VATGVVSPVGSPSAVAAQQAQQAQQAEKAPQAQQAKAESDRPNDEDSNSTSIVAAMATSLPTPKMPKLPKVSPPNVIAGLSALVVFSACAASVAAKLLGWGLPAPRAAAAAAERGMLRSTTPGEGAEHGYGNTFAYEGLVQEQEDGSPPGPQSTSRSASRMRNESPRAPQKKQPWF